MNHCRRYREKDPNLRPAGLGQHHRNDVVTAQARELNSRTREFDALHARMQTRKARQSVDELFCASDAELNYRDA
jgi:hypothetical protein